MSTSSRFDSCTRRKLMTGSVSAILRGMVVAAGLALNVVLAVSPGFAEGLPDLKIGSVSCQWVETGQTYTISFWVYNSGETAAAESIASIHIDSIHQFSGDVSIGPVGPGTHTELITVGPFQLSGYEDIVRVTADALDQVMENNESNNKAYLLVKCSPWDVNGDGEVNVGDLVCVCLRFGETGEPGWIREDVNRDGAISVGDLVVVALHWCD